mmetsp:Transcript_4687/g.10643  ORF Transcript_4687/g.10643 Transcript_4687/m.10643 type:complete len:286 (+) Transcript_4687:522-1379(+)
MWRATASTLPRESSAQSTWPTSSPTGNVQQWRCRRRRRRRTLLRAHPRPSRALPRRRPLEQRRATTRGGRLARARRSCLLARAQPPRRKPRAVRWRSGCLAARRSRSSASAARCAPPRATTGCCVRRRSKRRRKGLTFALWASAICRCTTRTWTGMRRPRRCACGRPPSPQPTVSSSPRQRPTSASPPRSRTRSIGQAATLPTCGRARRRRSRALAARLRGELVRRCSCGRSVCSSTSPSSTPRRSRSAASRTSALTKPRASYAATRGAAAWASCSSDCSSWRRS